MDSDPRHAVDAQLIQTADVHDSALDAMAGEGSALGRGGMATKLSAARLAARSGTATIIANGRQPDVIAQIAEGVPLGTFLQTHRRPQSARKQWLASLLHAQGKLVLDDGAVRGVSCIDSAGRERARGLVNYSSEEARALAGKGSADIESVLGYRGEEELIHRDNLVGG